MKTDSDQRTEAINTITLPPGYVPTPTQEFRAFHATQALKTGTGARQPQPIPRPIPRPPIPLPLPLSRGSRVLQWKQDPTVGEIGIRKAFLPGRVYTGPRDPRVRIQGLPPVSPNTLGDFIVSPASVDAFDAVHTFAVVRQALTLYKRLVPGTPFGWHWNTAGNTDPLDVHPHAGETMNAYYMRTEKALKFFFFTKPGDPPGSPKIYTCRSFDIVAHEAGHAILDGLKPGWLAWSNPPQTGGLHESFGDLTAIFLALSQLDQVEAIIAMSRADLHDKTFLADLAEEFGLALGRPNGLRNADNDLKLSEVGTEVHAISQVFTGGVYDVLADIFVAERDPATRDDAIVLYECGRYMASLVVRAIMAAPASAATYADVVNKMLSLTTADGKPNSYRQSIINRFTLREVLAPSVGAKALTGTAEVAAGVVDDPTSAQDRYGCCGTMQIDQDAGEEADLVDEIRQLAAELAASPSGNGGAVKGRKK